MTQEKTIYKCCRIRPLFSVVIPMYNRQDTISRCLQSVFNQDYQDFEVIVVDDCSVDGSVAEVRKYNDPRLRIIQLPNNLGVCGAIKDGVVVAGGSWILTLGSDDALRPGALRTFADMTETAPKDVGVIGAFGQYDTGGITPGTPPPEGPFGYEEYLKWRNEKGPTDYLGCRRRQVYETVRWTDSRRASQKIHLDIARQWKYWIAHEVLMTVHTDSKNRITGYLSALSLEFLRRMAKDCARDMEETLQHYGKDMLLYAPHWYWRTLQAAALQNLLAGKKIRGMRFLLCALYHKPWALQLAAAGVLGLLSSRALLAVSHLPRARKVFHFLSRKL